MNDIEYKIRGYEPEQLFHFFEEISSIPRGSGNEKGISDYLVGFAEERNLPVYQDEALNVIICKPGSRGKEDHAPVMLQGHMDMVCEKLAGIDHDFSTQGICLQIEGDMLRARGTTLGADNGAAVALMLAVLAEDSLDHPPLECVITTEEETGLGGAKALDKSRLRSRIMINLDSEEEGIATVSCAGGVRIDCTRPVCREPVSGTMVKLSVTGLLGGHSGSDIHKERQNGILIMVRILAGIMSRCGGKLVSFSGGKKENAIPRECEAALIFPQGQGEAALAQEMAGQMAGEIRREIQSLEPGFSFRIQIEEGQEAMAVPREDGDAFIRMLRLAPYGVQKRRPEESGFVISSVNLGVAETEEDTLRVVFSPRSSEPSQLVELKERVRLLADTFGFTVACRGEYPGWAYREESVIRKVFQEAYHDLTGEELKIEGIHAGLECGLFSSAMPGLDAIAVGPSIYDCHTPDEHLDLKSFGRFWKLLTEVLSRL